MILSFVSQGSESYGDAVKRSKSEDSSSPDAAWDSNGPLRAMMSAFQPLPTSAIKDGKVLPAPPAIMQEG